MAKKKVSIDYTSRDFNSIKESLVDYTRRYYPDVYQDFNEASFGSLMLDTVSYVGDILSYYLDYQVNESFLGTAFEKKNIVNLSRQLGYKFQEVASSQGDLSLYALIPANEFGLGPDSNYLPIIRQGSIFSSNDGNNFILSEDIRFDNPSNTVVVGRVDETSGIPTHYAIKASGEVISGDILEKIVSINEYKTFRKVFLRDNNVVEILSVEDSEGNEYFQVENLAQNIVYKSFPNKNSGSDQVREYLRPVSVPRRFVFEFDGENYFLQFGFGSEDEIKIDPVADPSSIALQLYGRDYISDVHLDPSKLLSTDKLGISPSNTQLKIKYRKNSRSNPNASVGAINNITNLIIEYSNLLTISSSQISQIRGSLECRNEKSINGSSVSPTSEEIKQRAVSYFATQSRAVTSKDYEAMAYAMPGKYGSISRCTVSVDQDSFKRNLNLYVLTEDKNSKLATASQTMKENLRIWLSNYKMINDTVDILDGKVVNIGINFEVIGDPSFNKSDLFASCINTLKKRYSKSLLMGTPFYITDVYYELNRLRGVIDTRTVTLTNKVGSAYSTVRYDISSNLSADGRRLGAPTNVCFEIKFPDADITGVIR